MAGRAGAIVAPLGDWLGVGGLEIGHGEKVAGRVSGWRQDRLRPSSSIWTIAGAAGRR